MRPMGEFNLRNRREAQAGLPVPKRLVVTAFVTYRNGSKRSEVIHSSDQLPRLLEQLYRDEATEVVLKAPRSW